MMKEVYAYCRTIYTIVSSKNIRKTFGFNRYGMVHGIFARLQIFETKTSPHIHLDDYFHCRNERRICKLEYI
jgi:hypothetical protein